MPPEIAGIDVSPLLDAALLPLALLAQADFPRGPGFYYSIVKLVVLLLAFLAWIYVCNAVQRDSDEAEVHAEKWNALLFVGGLIGFGLVWICPAFWLSILGMTVLTVCAVIAYSYRRHRHVPVPLWKKIESYFRSDGD